MKEKCVQPVCDIVTMFKNNKQTNKKHTDWNSVQLKCITKLQMQFTLAVTIDELYL